MPKDTGWKFNEEDLAKRLEMALQLGGTQTQGSPNHFVELWDRLHGKFGAEMKSTPDWRNVSFGGNDSGKAWGAGGGGTPQLEKNADFTMNHGGMTPDQWRKALRLSEYGTDKEGKLVQPPTVVQSDASGSFNANYNGQQQDPDFDAYQPSDGSSFNPHQFNDVGSILNRRDDLRGANDKVTFTKQDNDLMSYYKAFQDRMRMNQEAPYIKAKGISVRDLTSNTLNSQINSMRNQRDKTGWTADDEQRLKDYQMELDGRVGRKPSQKSTPPQTPSNQVSPNGDASAPTVRPGWWARTFGGASDTQWPVQHGGLVDSSAPAAPTGFKATKLSKEEINKLRAKARLPLIK